MGKKKRPRRQLSVGTSSDDSIHDDGPLTGGQCPPLRGVLFVTCEEKREFPGTAWMSTAVAVCGSDVLAALCRFALACPSHASLPPLPATLAPLLSPQRTTTTQELSQLTLSVTRTIRHPDTQSDTTQYRPVIPVRGVRSCVCVCGCAKMLKPSSIPIICRATYPHILDRKFQSVRFGARYESARYTTSIRSLPISKGTCRHLQTDRCQIHNHSQKRGVPCLSQQSSNYLQKYVIARTWMCAVAGSLPEALSSYSAYYCIHSIGLFSRRADRVPGFLGAW